MEKYLIIFIILIVLYYLHRCWVENLIKSEIRKENFADSPASGMDDSAAIQALGSIAKDLMSGGGLKVQGDSSFAGVSNFAKEIKVAGRDILGELNAINTRLKDMNGVKIGRWTLNDENVAFTIRDNVTGGDKRVAIFNGSVIDIPQSIDDLRANAIMNNQRVSAKPLNDIGQCFDFGSQGRTNCTSNAGWATVQLVKR